MSSVTHSQSSSGVLAASASTAAAATTTSSSTSATAKSGQASGGAKSASKHQHSKRGRSNSQHGGAGASSHGSPLGSASAGQGAGSNNGWIRVGRNGKPLFHQHAANVAAAAAVAASTRNQLLNTNAAPGAAGPSRDPVSAVAATTASKWRRHGHRIVQQPAHPQEPRSRSSSAGAGLLRRNGSVSDDAIVTSGHMKLSASARRRLKRRQRRLEAASAVLHATPADDDGDDEDDDGGEDLESSDDFVPDADHVAASHHASPSSAAETDTRVTTALPTPSTLPRGGSIQPHPVVIPPPAPSVLLRPLVRCTNGSTTVVRTLTDIMRSTADDYDLEADTPIVRPADPTVRANATFNRPCGSVSASTASMDTESPIMGAGAGSNASSIPELSLGAALDDGMEDRHPSAYELEEGYAAMHTSAGQAGDAEDSRRSPGGARYLTVPPSAFTVDSIATPNTYAALPHGPLPPPIPERHTYQDILNSYDVGSGSFAWHDDEAGTARFAEQLEFLCAEVTQVLRVRPLLRQLDAPAYVLGDIHGNFADLSFFLKSFLVMNDIQLTPCQVLCLGDYVDRGPNSVECVALLFALCIEAPDRVVLLRGNHEDRVVCGDHRTYGDDCFWAQACRRFGPETGTRVFRAVTRVFKELPLGCELQLPMPGSPKILCTHGGFPRFNINDPETFRRIELLRRDDFPRFLTLFPNNPLAQDDSGPDEDLPDFVESAWFTAFDLMWSDPTTGETEAERAKLDDNGFCCNMRGLNVMSFSQKAVEEFLKATGYAMLFRAHQEKQFGMRISKSSKVLTLFSSSNYQGHGNGAGCAVVDAQGHVQLVVKN